MVQATDIAIVPTARTIAAGEGWSVSEFICTAGRGERAFEERHAGFSFAAVVEGTFNYHGDTGRAALSPGAMLLGNAGACYSCGHDHGRGDRCIALNVADALFMEVAASHAGTSGFRFPVAAAIAAGSALPAFLQLQLWQEQGETLADEARAIAVIENTLSHISGVVSSAQTIAARDLNRVREAVALIEEAADVALDLATLASTAGMSRYHFLRVFRRVAGVTPYQCLLAARLRRAALALATTAEPVTTIALAAGFGDLSTFNWRFRKTFGMTPSAYRQRH